MILSGVTQQQKLTYSFLCFYHFEVSFESLVDFADLLHEIGLDRVATVLAKALGCSHAHVFAGYRVTHVVTHPRDEM